MYPLKSNLHNRGITLMTYAAAKTIQSIREEYETRKERKNADRIYKEGLNVYESFPPHPQVGDLTHLPATDELYICHGVINGDARWARVSPNL